jgi:hypothetical protein
MFALYIKPLTRAAAGPLVVGLTAAFAAAAPAPLAAYAGVRTVSAHGFLMSRAPAPRAFSPQAPPPPKAPPPATSAEIMKLVDQHNSELKDFVDKGNFSEIWVPALATKDAAVYLEDHLDQVDAAHRADAESAVSRLERACWLLDAVGDLGNRPQVVDAYQKYTDALAEVQSYFPGK